eukprot:5192699-Pyramimonas_sp.AAC.1
MQDTEDLWDAIHVEECRASLWSPRRFCKCRVGRAVKHLQLGDKLSAILARSKGRATSWQLLTLRRRRCALQ